MSFISRRTFLHQGLGAAAAVIAAPGMLPAAASASGAAIPRPCAPGAWRKHGILMEATEEWEQGQIQNFT